MKLLKIENKIGYFRDAEGGYQPIDKIAKDDLLRLVSLTLDENETELDELDEKALPNQVHQVVYRSIAAKLIDLKVRKETFLDQKARLFLDDYERYKEKAA